MMTRWSSSEPRAHGYAERTGRPCGEKATRAVGVEGLRLHDLRHTCNTLTAATGASTRELMHRMGHASARAALRYQHATRERDEVIAAALSDLIEAGPAKLSNEIDS